MSCCCLSRVCRSIYRAYWGVEERPKKKVPTNDELQKQLVALEERIKDEPLKTQGFWDEFASESSDDDPTLPQYLASQAEKKPGRAYDLGCGAEGVSARYLASLGWQVTVVDVSKKVIERLGKYKSDKLEPVQAFLENFEPEKGVDLVVAVNVLGFCSPGKIKEIWTRIHAALNEGGILICTLPVPYGRSFARWSMDFESFEQFFLKGRFKVLGQDDDLGPFTDHPLSVLLQKV